MTLCVGYLVFIFLFQKYMQSRETPIAGPNVVRFKAFHNAFLCAFSACGSAALIKVFVQSQQDLFYIYQRDGFYALWCDTNNLAQLQTNLYLWYYLFYLSKFYEFIDTVLLIAAKVSPRP